MTRSVEIPEEAVRPVVRVAVEYLQGRHMGKLEDAMRAALAAALPYLAPAAGHTYGDGTHYPPTGGAHVTERCGPNCPPAPAEPWYIARQRHSWEELHPGQWLCKDCGAEEGDEGNIAVPPLTSFCSPAPIAKHCGGSLPHEGHEYASGEGRPTQCPGHSSNPGESAPEQSTIARVAPAGDGGLREALEKLAGDMAYDSSDGGAKIRAVLDAHPAVSQPVDREAGEKS